MGIQFALYGYGPVLCLALCHDGESTELVNFIQFRPSFQSIRFNVSQTTRILSFSFRIVILGVGFLGILGCPQDNSAFQAENQRFKKQISKQESVIASLQEANKVMQQQIDLLNQEARESQQRLEDELKASHQKFQELSQGHQAEGSKLQTLENENRKLTGDARWLRAQRDQMRKALKVLRVGGKTEELSFPFPIVLQVTEKALSRYGYKVMASMQTDQKAVYVTERKVSPATSLEVSGFRNQYLLAVNKGKSEKTTIWVKAEFEKLSQDGHVFRAGPKELSDIELRLIQEIQRTLENGQTPKASPPKG